jgi:hypothetical protein
VKGREHNASFRRRRLAFVATTGGRVLGHGKIPDRPGGRLRIGSRNPNADSTLVLPPASGPGSPLRPVTAGPALGCGVAVAGVAVAGQRPPPRHVRRHDTSAATTRPPPRHVRRHDTSAATTAAP